MKKKLNATLLTIFVLIFAQSVMLGQNCTDYLIFRNPVPPYKLDSQTKSATCQAGRTYKLVLVLSEGKSYRLSFFASAVFDNRIHFKVIDKSNGQAVIDLPGESENNEKGTAVLRPYLKGDRMVHPYFDFFPKNTTNLEVIIDVKASERPDDDEIRRGCVGVFLQNKIVISEGFPKEN